MVEVGDKFPLKMILIGEVVVIFKSKHLRTIYLFSQKEVKSLLSRGLKSLTLRTSDFFQVASRILPLH